MPFRLELAALFYFALTLRQKVNLCGNSVNFFLPFFRYNDNQFVSMEVK